MNINQRKEKLNQLQKEASLNKIAEDVMSDVNNLDIADPDEYAHQVFLKLLENLHIDGLDD